MNDELLISFCIPTYNRKEKLLKTINNIIKNAELEKCKKKIEICISDNGSSDGTYNELLKLKNNANVQFTLYKFKQNMGFDTNVLKVMSLASGKYIWLFGDDDILKKYSLTRIINELQYNYDFYLCNREEIDLNNHIKKRFWLDKYITTDKLYTIRDQDDLQRYFDDCIALGGIFAFIASDIIKREKISLNGDSFIGSAYAHVGLICGSLVLYNCTIKYIYDALVSSPVGEQFENCKNYIDRTKLDFVGMKMIAGILFSGNDFMKYKFLGILHHEHPVLNLEALSKSDQLEREKLYNEMLDVGYSSKEIDVYKKCLTYKSVVLMYRIVRKVRKLLRVNK